MSLYLMADSDYQEFKALEAKSLEISAEAIASATAKATSLEMDVEGDTATIKVEGMLTPKRIGFLDFFGKPQTVWGDISASIHKAENAGLKNFNIVGSSGGGAVDGMFEAMDTVANSSMNITGKVTGEAQSAFYMLLSQADVIEALSPYNWFGSVGVKVGLDSTEEVSNSDSPNKIASSKNDDGKYAIQETLDELYSMITPRMARGRNTTIAKINSDWGRGGTMTAKTALSRGMIDSINEPKPAGRSGKAKGSNMDINKLKADHPDLYAAVLAEGKEIGKAEFQELAAGHVGLAELSGDNSRAMADIAAGNSITPACQIHHTTAATKRSMIEARGEEAPDAIGEGKDPQKEASPEAKNEDDILVADSKAYYKAMGVINV